MRVPSRRCGDSGLHLPVLGLDLSAALQAQNLSPCLIGAALDLGVTHVDVTASSATGFTAGQERIGQLIAPWRRRRDEMVVSARIGLGTQNGPLAGFGSRRQILSGLDGLLRRTGLGYLDLLYAHRFDAATPLWETTNALTHAVQQGKVLYIGLSSFAPAPLSQASRLLADMDTPVTAYQAPYSLLNRGLEAYILPVLREHRLGCVATDSSGHTELHCAALRASRAGCMRCGRAQGPAQIAAERDQSMEQLAVSWVLRDPAITSVLTSAAHPYHLAAYGDAAHHTRFAPGELAELDACFPRL